MKSDGVMKHFILAFLLAVVFYAVFYHFIEHRRTRKGPWEVTFTTNKAGAPALFIAEPKLGITNFEISFPEQQPPPASALAKLVFRQPKQVPYNVPFGKCVFMDTTFLPGTVTLDMYGHEIELLPRVLVIDRQEHPWLSDHPITLHPVQSGAFQRTRD